MTRKDSKKMENSDNKDKKDDKKSSESKENKKDVEECKTTNDKISELTDTLKRLQAEFDNYRKRTEKECKFTRELEKKDMIIKILPIIDYFEMALKNKGKEGFEEGVEMIYSQLITILENEGLKPMKEECEFDPTKHEAIMKEKSEQPENNIIQTIQKGYLFKEKVLRQAKVKISGGNNGEKKECENN